MFLYNMDFAMEWPRPLPPNVQLVGALLPTQAKPLPPIFEVCMQHQLWPRIPALQLMRCKAPQACSKGSREQSRRVIMLGHI